MIPANYFAHVIQAERERDLERWQRVRDARAAMRPRPGWSRMARLRGALEPLRRLGRPMSASIASDDCTASAACC